VQVEGDRAALRHHLVGEPVHQRQQRRLDRQDHAHPTLAQQRLPKLAVLLMSGFSTELLDADRDSPLSWELLRKPYSRGELAAAMARLMAARA